MVTLLKYYKRIDIFHCRILVTYHNATNKVQCIFRIGTQLPQ